MRGIFLRRRYRRRLEEAIAAGVLMTPSDDGTGGFGNSRSPRRKMQRPILFDLSVLSPYFATSTPQDGSWEKLMVSPVQCTSAGLSICVCAYGPYSSGYHGTSGRALPDISDRLPICMMPIWQRVVWLSVSQSSRDDFVAGFPAAGNTLCPTLAGCNRYSFLCVHTCHSLIDRLCAW